jgi:hypothetical protein
MCGSITVRGATKVTTIRAPITSTCASPASQLHLARRRRRAPHPASSLRRLAGPSAVTHSPTTRRAYSNARLRITPAPSSPADSFGFSIDDAEWLSQRPPIQRVHVWYGGLDDAVASDRLLAGCTLSDLEPGVVRGPNGYWTVRPGGDSTMVLLWHGRVVTTLTDVDELAFAP